MMLAIAKEIHHSTQSLTARHTLGWPRPGAAELALSRELLTNDKSRGMRGRISGSGHKRGHCGAGRERVPGSFVTLLPLRAGTEADKGSSVKEPSLCV